MANRWLVAEFSLGSNNLMLVAVSQTSDPTGSWYAYSFDVDDMPDYMKFGVWPDGYYMATNTYNGNDVYVFERSVMLSGGSSPQMLGFDNPYRPNSGFHCIMPLDNDGQAAPSGTPGQFITINDDAWGNGGDAIWLYELNADWNAPSNSTFQRTQVITVPAFESELGGSSTYNYMDNIPQPGTSQKLDGISTVLMYKASYRNFNGDQRLVVTHTIAEGQSEAAIRWYELQNNGSGWNIRQEGNVNPDNVSRWNPSITINAQKEIGMGFSVSDANSVYPGIRIIGQSTDENNNANGVFDIDETVILNGQYSQTSYNRWGDYCNISVDPTDDRTFWFTTEYVKSNTHGTRIVSFVFPDNCTPPTTQASNFQVTGQTDVQINLSWTRGNGNNVIVLAKENSAVDTDPQNGLTYVANAQFGSGAEIGTGNYVVYSGSGTTVNVTGLNQGTTYHFAVYEFNSSDNCYLKPGETVAGTTLGPPTVLTLPMVQINTNDAIGEGNVTSENGSTVTERGLCWGINNNPTIADNYASNGSGLGSYQVNLTGLSSSTTYYVRAYAVNSYGISYGDNVSFTTGCGVVTQYPYTQDFDQWNVSNPGISCTADGSVSFLDCWTNVSGDNADWDILNGATASTNTGPSDDVDGGGNYIYLEASSCNNKTASVLTPHFDLTGLTHPYMSFYVHMYGSNMGDLEVSYTTDNGLNWTVLTTLSGEIGNFWKEITPDISTLSGFSDVQFMFTGTTGNGYQSDMAIDNFSIRNYLPPVNNYCNSEGNMDYNTAITAVIFNQINNASGGKTAPYADYTNITTELQRGQSYNMTIRVNTDGNFTVGTAVWIDWNQDGDFDDNGEEYDLGLATNVADGPTSDSPLSITIPMNADFGKTRMRVSTKYNDYATSCETGFDGEVEDYTVIVMNDCSAVAFWDGVSWKDKDDNILSNATDLNNRFLIVKNDLITGGNIDACGLYVKSGNTVTINSDNYIQLVNDVYNEGTIDIKNNGMLSQTSDSGIIQGNGTYKFQRITQNLPNQYAYVYWSAPVQNITLGDIVNDAWRYYSFDASTQSWVMENNTTVMQTGSGYAVSAPNSFSGGVLDVNFMHNNTPFNNGDISASLQITGTGAQGDDDWNLVGNPYPSPINFNELVNQNTNIEGAYYLWTNCAGLDGNGQHQSIGYTIYSVGSGATSACNGNGVSATQFIPAAQGFYVEANSSGNMWFKNSQRVVVNTPFVNRLNFDRLWLDFYNNSDYNQNLIGFFDEATDQRDRLYDAKTIDASTFALYSFINNEKYSIQGLSAWNGAEKIIDLGFVTSTAGMHTIAINRSQGVLSNSVNIYLKDLYNNMLIDLRNTAYQFQTTQGTFNDRFQLIFTENNLNTDEIKPLKQINLINNDGVFRLISDDSNLQKVDIYTVSGKKILSYTTKQPDKNILMNLHTVPSQLLIFRIFFIDGTSQNIKAIR
jgi:hypothetical protein